MICEPLPFNVIDRTGRNVLDSEPDPFGIPQPTPGETRLLIGTCIAAVLLITLAVIGATVTSRWAWNHPGQFGVWIGLACFAGWGFWEVIKG